MTVKELLEKLQQYDPELEVRVSTDWGAVKAYEVELTTDDFPSKKPVAPYVHISGG